MTDFSFQLYTARNFPPLEETLGLLARLGYASVEGYPPLYEDAAAVAALKAGLEATGLNMPTGHFPLEMIEAAPGRVIAIARDLGIRAVYVPYIPAEARPDAGPGYEALGRRLARAGAPLRAEGIGFGWHNHEFELQPTADGALPLEALFAGAPELEWEADIAWVIKGGADPFEAIARFGPRITAVHVKDIAPEGENADEEGWADLGRGVVDWKALMAALRGTPARRFVIEHDNPGDLARFAGRSLAAARTW